MERSLIIVKPSAVMRGLTGRILSRFEDKNFRIIGSKIVNATKEELKLHYAEHYGKPYYSEIEVSMMSGPIFIFAIKGSKGSVAFIRKMLGTTHPMEAEPGTIRGDFAQSTDQNICHASNSVESGEREINVWFKSGELID